MPYVLNSKLFSDYSIKHRVMFIPEGKQARFLDNEESRVNSTIEFPVGTIIAKTFSFVDQPRARETPYETRLLIKRQRTDGQNYWEALEYIWQDAGNGKRKAVLTQFGGSAAASWDYVDVDSGKRQTGSTAAYMFPNASQCAICHSNNDVDPGSAPIGPKPRNLNRAYVNESPMFTGQAQHPVNGKNQLKFMCETGLMNGCPSTFELDQRQVATNVNHIPKFNKPCASLSGSELRALPQREWSSLEHRFLCGRIPGCRQHLRYLQKANRKRFGRAGYAHLRYSPSDVQRFNCALPHGTGSRGACCKNAATGAQCGSHRRCGLDQPVD